MDHQQKWSSRSVGGDVAEALRLCCRMKGEQLPRVSGEGAGFNSSGVCWQQELLLIVLDDACLINNNDGL